MPKTHVRKLFVLRADRPTPAWRYRLGIRVLIVDDTDHVRNMLLHMLTLDGFLVVGSAAGATDALDMLDETGPDIVIMDMKMPVVDGISATRSIREQHPTLPVILYTAYLDDEILERAHDAGVTACIGKVEGIASLEREISALCLELVEH